MSIEQELLDMEGYKYFQNKQKDYLKHLIKLRMRKHDRRTAERNKIIKNNIRSKAVKLPSFDYQYKGEQFPWYKASEIWKEIETQFGDFRSSNHMHHNIYQSIMNETKNTSEIRPLIFQYLYDYLIDNDYQYLVLIVHCFIGDTKHEENIKRINI